MGTRRQQRSLPAPRHSTSNLQLSDLHSVQCCQCISPLERSSGWSRHRYLTSAGHAATFNEPFTTAGYASGAGAPGLKKSETFAYIVAHNVIRSHAAVVKAFRDLKASSPPVVHQKARISITLNSDAAYPLDATNPLDVAAAERKMQFELGWFLSPMITGDYPAVMRGRVGDRLPRFTPEETALVKGSYDLLMLNHYSSKLVTDCGASPKSKSPCKKLGKGWERDLGVDISHSNELPGSRRSSKDRHGRLNCGWFTAYPPGYHAEACEISMSRLTVSRALVQPRLTAFCLFVSATQGLALARAATQSLGTVVYAVVIEQVVEVHAFRRKAQKLQQQSWRTPRARRKQRAEPAPAP
ncbi:hypothetical protein PF002_g5481 [Phytophthora fragariae]|uniref:Uncharacterized protein n=1 Tax=Phytophthora fragariae TaxID=53985 RepID=A0A6A3UP89_9STRA|nr:hypothetical protein PF006_g3673 [Phytophthora fragariae]KAE9249059.1 hypothetical protein PF002_g5481 [Phytophthora fragariae]